MIIGIDISRGPDEIRIPGGLKGSEAARHPIPSRLGLRQWQVGKASDALRRSLSEPEKYAKSVVTLRESL
jgi:hypothetical protein